jgi:threonine dehydrogenase-like Zn-dependent dehydrogenase
MALAMRDADIRLGDHVAVFGMGAIGLIAIQLARLAGADLVIAVDPIAHRREVARALGADIALDPVAEGDTGVTIRKLTGWRGAADTPPSPERRRVRGGYWEAVTQTGQLGVDVAVEVAGSTRALQDAIRSTRFGGTICMLSFYGREATGLHLGEEFHVNQLRLVSARAESLPLRDAPAWNLARFVDVSLAWLASGRLRTDGIVWPIVPFSDSADAYRAIDEHPEQSIKLGIRFG